MSDFLLKAGNWDAVTRESAGWRHLSFGVWTGSAGTSEDLATAENEVALVPLGGRCLVEARAKTFEFGGRRNVFDGIPWALYLPPGTTYRLHALTDLELAVCGARCERSFPPALVAPGDVAIETRGAGNATRQINHILPPDFPAHRLLVVEVFTPAGNWSSYPPHKHDEDRPPDEVVLEEVYYYRTTRPEAFAVQRLYSPRHGVDVTVTVRDGDLMLVPYGYHTTCAAHGYDLYYLNALAGERRSMAASDDPDLAWVRPAWERMATDPRVPLVR
ncbi:MAG: 5-deoxy-glucuronate isomerase [Actinomycetota bacterium]|nr:5-deoxy-glucuronate isomerase [Actinomycetota bacterium]